MITQDKFDEVVRLISKGRYSQRQVAQLAGVSRGTVGRIAAGKRAKAIKGSLPVGEHELPSNDDSGKCSNCKAATVDGRCVRCDAMRFRDRCGIPRDTLEVVIPSSQLVSEEDRLPGEPTIKDIYDMAKSKRERANRSADRIAAPGASETGVSGPAIREYFAGDLSQLYYEGA